MAQNSATPSFVCNSGTPGGYNQLHGNALFDLENWVYADLYWQFQPYADEIGAATKMQEQNSFTRKSILIFDQCNGNPQTGGKAVQGKFQDGGIPLPGVFEEPNAGQLHSNADD